MESKYRTTCNLNNLPGIRAFAREALQHSGAAAEVCNDIVLALDEMCSNLMIHGHRCDAGHAIELIIYLDDPAMAVLEILDDSTIFNITEFQEPDLRDLIHEKRKGGLGIRLVKTIMDEITYFERDGWKVCRLVKRISG